VSLRDMQDFACHATYTIALYLVGGN